MNLSNIFQNFFKTVHYLTKQNHCLKRHAKFCSKTTTFNSN